MSDQDTWFVRSGGVQRHMSGFGNRYKNHDIIKLDRLFPGQGPCSRCTGSVVGLVYPDLAITPCGTLPCLLYRANAEILQVIPITLVGPHLPQNLSSNARNFFNGGSFWKTSGLG